jgi:DNA repair protein RadC
MSQNPESPSPGTEEDLRYRPRRRADVPELRDRLFRAGSDGLGTSELLRLLLGRSGPDAPSLSRVLRRQGLRGLASLSAGDLRRLPGFGPVGAARAAAAFELGRRAYRESGDDRPRIDSPARAFREVRRLGGARKEHLVGLYLDAQNGLLHRETISIGSLNTTRTHPREILHPAVIHLALGFVLIHNHPSGCLEPSPEDVEFTRSIQRASQILGIELYDHLIVAGTRYVSLRERGLL